MLLVCFLFFFLISCSIVLALLASPFSPYQSIFFIVIFFDGRKEFAAIIRECWRDDAGHRPSSVQLLEKLEAAIESLASSIPPSVSATSPINSSINHSPTDLTSYPPMISSTTSSTTTTASAHPISSPTTISSTSTHSIPSPSINRFDIPGVYPRSSSPLLFSSFSYIVNAEVVTTLAGSREQGFKDGKGSKASFKLPHGIFVNPLDACLYVCDRKNNAIRRVSMQGIHTLEPSYTSSFRFPIDLLRYLQVMLILSYTRILLKIRLESS